MRVPRRLFASALGATLVFLWIPSHAIAQSTTATASADTVRGRVIADSVPLAKVVIHIVALPDSERRATTTDASGAFTAVFNRPATSYLLSATLIGYRPDTMRIRRPAGAPASGARIDVTVRMSHAVQTLQRVQTTATRPRPVRDLMGDTPMPGETGALVDPAGILTGDETGDLSALLGMIPGLDVTPGAAGAPSDISIAGLSSDQNSVTVNGVSSGATLPRDGTFTRVLTATYDPSKGGGGGVITSSILSTHGYGADKMLHVSLEAPELQWTTPVAARLGQLYTRPIVSGVFATAPRTGINYKGWLHSQNTNFQLSQTTSDVVSLTNAGGSSLAAIGVAADSVMRLLTTLAQLGIPARVQGVPSARVTTQGNFATRLNLSAGVSNLYLSEPDGRGLTHSGAVSSALGTPGGTPRPVPPDVVVILSGGWSDAQALNITPTSLASRGGDSRRYNGMIQASRAANIGATVNELNTALNASSSHSAPYLNLPGASVLLQSQLPDGTNAFTTLQAAGGSAGSSTSSNWSWEAIDKIKWDTFDARHQFQVSVDGTIDHYGATQLPGAGTYFYNSLGDFAANAPASFSRTLESVASHSTGLRGALGLADVHTLSTAHALVAQYGLRIEDDHFAASPMFNPLVDSLFGLRTDHVPSTLTVSPMAGFTWTYAKLPTGRPDPRGQLTGGVRDWRGVLATQSLDPYIRRTGLDAANEQVQCVGAAVPMPDWSTFVASPSSIPDACADAAGNTSLITASPTVSVFAPNYVPSHSVRADLTWTGTLGPAMTLYVHESEAMNTDLPSVLDANFNGTSRFVLANEGGRPVYVQSSSIVPGTGAVPSSESRVTSQFAQVSERQSDGRSRNGLVTTQLSYQPEYNPRSSALSEVMSIAYTYSNTRTSVNGFTTTTDGDPRVSEWSTSPASRHSVVISGLLRVPTWASIRASVAVRSGFAFTPRVNGDINGDGYLNDRAFIFDPATAADPAVAAAMRDLLASAPSSARDCLRHQLGTIADANSCTGPWTATLNLSAGLDAYRLGFKNHGSVSLILNNALGAADQLLHGASKLHGWGQTAFPDPTLLDVRGFDQSTQRFRYDVNPQFGSTTQSLAGYRVPFSLVLDAKFDFGPNRERSLMSVFTRPVVDSGQRDVETLRKRIMRIEQQAPFDGVLSEATKLGLTPEQAQTFRDADARYEAERTRVYTDFAKYVAGLQPGYDSDALETKWHDAMRTLVLAQADLGDLMRSTLSRAQLDAVMGSNLLKTGNWYLMWDRQMIERYVQGRLNPV